MLEKLKIELIHAATFKHTGTKDFHCECSWHENYRKSPVMGNY